MLQTNSEEIEMRILYSVTFFSENHFVCEITWKNIVERVKPRMTIWRMRTACWMSKATNTRSQYVILTAVPLKQLAEQTHLNVRLYLMPVLFYMTYSLGHINILK
jgi:hypothetical protein